KNNKSEEKCMKNKKLLAALATLALGGVTAMGVSLAGCAHNHAYSNDWDKDETGHWHYATCGDLKEGDEGYRKDFAEHVYGDDNVCDECGYEKVVTPPETTEYTVTLDAHGGTLVGSATVKTVGGKITELPAAPTAEAPELTFNGWYSAAEGGEKITTETVFDKDATIHAQWRATDGLYTTAGKLIEALEDIPSSDTAKKQYGGTGIELSAGDEFVIKVEGTVLSHAAGTLELWTAAGCHGVDFNQTAGTFTVQAGNDRAFDIYAKYYEDATPCWSIYINDGLTDELHAGGAYLVGTGWQGGSWDIAKANYIDPENGLTVTLAADADFKITDCLDVTEGENRGWKYNDAKYYAVKDNAAGYLNFANVGASGNVKVLTPGEYTITVVTGETEEDIKFVFTPAEGLDPAPVEDKFVKDGFYLAGEGFDGAAWSVKEGFYVDPENGLTVTFNKGANFQIIRCTDGVTGSPAWEYGAASYYKMATGKEEGYIDITNSGNKTVRAAGEYTITVDDTGETPVFVFTPAAEIEPDLTEPVIHYYIKGTAVDIGWSESVTDKYELKETEAGSGIYEMTIELAVGEFMFYSRNEDENGAMTVGNKFIQSDKVVEGTDCVNLDQTNIKTLAAGTYAFSYNAQTEKLSISFTPAATETTPETPEA
ncbi:MAG: InlB B-repeat-containing protein, partial [Clostridia bacterium]|nr:InlB B-repeat-containing protein [Clostridia bacterium]